MITEKQREILNRNNAESKNITREAIRGALLLLMKEEDYQKISITEIILRSGVSRSAFYRNYISKDEVLFDTMDCLFQNLIHALGQNLEENLRIIYAMVRQYRKTLKLLTDAGLEYHILDLLNRHITYGTSRYETYLWNGLLYNLIVEWINRPCEEEADIIIAEIMDSLREISNHILCNQGNFPNTIFYDGK